jgi:hypothetical protein
MRITPLYLGHLTTGISVQACQWLINPWKKSMDTMIMNLNFKLKSIMIHDMPVRVAVIPIISLCSKYKSVFTANVH